MNAETTPDMLAPEYVLGLLEGEDAAKAERLLSVDDEFRAHVEYWRERMSALDETAPRLDADTALWRKIETGLAAPGAAFAPRVAEQSPSRWAALWENLGFWRGAGLAASAASLVLAVGLGLSLRAQSEKPVMIAVLLTDANRPAAVVNVLANGDAELLPLDAILVPPGRALQVWTLWDRARGPVSVGLSRSPQRIPLDLGRLPKTSVDQLFEISLEPESGSPTGRPTGPVLMKGTASTPL